jgi:hypothetical protein
LRPLERSQEIGEFSILWLMPLNQNLLMVNTSGALVLFDADWIHEFGFAENLSAG